MFKRMIACARDRRARREDGAAAVEFALVSLLLLTLVFGIIGFGVIFAQQLSLGNGARQGARYGVVADRTCANIATEARSGAATISMAAEDVTIEVRRGATESAAAASPALCNVVPPANGSTSVEPCQGSISGDNLYVYTKFDSEITVPLLPMSGSVGLAGLGVFRCEYQ